VFLHELCTVNNCEVVSLSNTYKSNKHASTGVFCWILMHDSLILFS